MMTATHEIEHVRPQVEAIVGRLKRDGLTRMRAYQRLGADIGKSGRWVRKIIGRDETAEVRLRDAWNIQAAYERLCARIDGVSERIEVSTERMREDKHAARTGGAAAGAGAPRLAARVDGEERS